MRALVMSGPLVPTRATTLRASGLSVVSPVAGALVAPVTPETILTSESDWRTTSGVAA